jgi:hypothetical protein
MSEFNRTTEDIFDMEYLCEILRSDAFFEEKDELFYRTVDSFENEIDSDEMNGLVSTVSYQGMTVGGVHLMGGLRSTLWDTTYIYEYYGYIYKIVVYGGHVYVYSLEILSDRTYFCNCHYIEQISGFDTMFLRLRGNPPICRQSTEISEKDFSISKFQKSRSRSETKSKKIKETYRKIHDMDLGSRKKKVKRNLLKKMRTEHISPQMGYFDGKDEETSADTI